MKCIWKLLIRLELDQGINPDYTGGRKKNGRISKSSCFWWNRKPQSSDPAEKVIFAVEWLGTGEIVRVVLGSVGLIQTCVHNVQEVFPLAGYLVRHLFIYIWQRWTLLESSAPGKHPDSEIPDPLEFQERGYWKESRVPTWLRED